MKEKLLSDYCRWDDSNSVIKLLKQNFIIDLTYNDGIYFRLSIKHNNIKMLNSLLQYYEQNNLKDDSNSLEYKVAKYKLQQILQDAVNTFTPSKEMEVVLEKYLPKEEDVNSEQDLSDFENLLGFGTEEIHPQIEEHNTTTNVALSGNNTHEVY
ncbi:hypothetical protein MPCS_01767 (plasmid) [Candidatus Megaera polyxenophila]|nr:hypothetical protein MPCS_01767 [Candidatus Megaera polyxenophila]